MSEDVRVPQSYADVATFRGERVLLYRQFGSYQGEWVLFSIAGDEYHLYRGWYGSCSGCDSLQAMQATSVVTREDVDEFISDYHPFAEIPRVTARKLAANGTFSQVFPANYRSDYSDLNMDELVAEIETQIKLEEDLPLGKDDAMRAMSQETRRRVLEKINVLQMIVRVIDEDADDKLVAIEGKEEEEVYLWLQDSSTTRKYLLRVPPEMARVKEAKAWTFYLQEDEYHPLLET